jgi:3D-(3,5/4)-trihydroxycyclohexane-1,2-dione acylhydrolase (decyclizing)
MVGDGSYLMMAQEIVTSIQEGFKLIIVLLDSQGYASIGGLSRAIGSGGFGTEYRYRDQERDTLTGGPLPVDLAANAASLGAVVHVATDRSSLEAGLDAARRADRTAVVYVSIDPTAGVPGYDSWWDVAVAQVSEQDSVRDARKAWEAGRTRERWFL